MALAEQDLAGQNLSEQELAEQMDELTEVEDFFELFQVEYEPEKVQLGRVKLLTLFQRNLAEFEQPISFAQYQSALNKAYCLFLRGVVVTFNGSPCANCNSEC